MNGFVKFLIFTLILVAIVMVTKNHIPYVTAYRYGISQWNRALKALTRGE